VTLQARAGEDVPQKPADRQEQTRRDEKDDRDRQVAFLQQKRRAGLTRPSRREGRLDPVQHRARDPDQRPDRRDAHRAGAEEPHLLPEHGADPGLDAQVRHRLLRGQDRSQHRPGDHQPERHGGAYREADEMADAEQRQGQVASDAGRAGADAEPGRGAVEHQPGLGQDREASRS
jgi:hypothetical protein